MGTPVALDAVTALALPAGATATLRGAVYSSLDGSTFQAAGLFDFAAGGLRIVEVRSERGEVVVDAPGAPAPACQAAGITAPCLVPRLSVLAHERLRTQAELARSLTGGVELEGFVAPPPPPMGAGALAALGGTGLLAVFAIAWLLVRAYLQMRARTALGRVQEAAREAMRATRGDPSLAGVRTQVTAMLARATHLEAARRACLGRLAKIDVPSLVRRREAAARSAAPEAGEALAWLTAEQAEAHRLESDLSSSVLGLQRIESALRVVTLRAREHRGTRARAAVADPVDAAALEMTLRDEALEEAARATLSS